MKALIAGAGIGGLTAALFLNRAGIEVEILERAEELRELGVGINILPHAVRELAELGLLAELERTGIATRELIYTNRFGQTVWREPRGLAGGHAHPQVSIHRGHLLGIFHRAVLDRLGPAAIRTGWTLEGFGQSADRVEIGIADRSGTFRSLSGDLLIGADGIHSAVRAQLYPDEGPPVWYGVMLWRGGTHWSRWRDGRTMAIAGGNFAKFVFYPIAPPEEESGLCLTNWAVMARTGEPGSPPPRREDWSRPGRFIDALAFVRDHFRLDFVDPAAIIRSTATFFEYPNCDRDPLSAWSFGRVTLLGDAAHPMYPVGSNGASQAIIDARSLVQHLAGTAPVEQALSAYDAERRPATEKIVLSNRKGGPERVIDLVEARAPHGFDDVETVASHAEREALVKGYAGLAGFLTR